MDKSVGAFLEILVQPQPKFRFRYKSEMTGKHGSLLGIHPPATAAAAARLLENQPAGPSSSSGAEKNLNVVMNKNNEASGTSVTRLSRGWPYQAQPPTSPVLNLREIRHEDYWRQGNNNDNSNNNNNSDISVTNSADNSIRSAANLSVNGSKIYPTVKVTSYALQPPELSRLSGFHRLAYALQKLNNFPGNAIIRCSLVSESPPHYPHVHALGVGQLLGKDQTTESYEDSSNVVDFVEIPISPESSQIAVFHGLNIIYTGKKGMRKILTDKLEHLEDGDVRKVGIDQIDSWSVNTNLNVVCLYFEAFFPDDGEGRKRICDPVVSYPIQHNKSTQTGDLRIVRIDKHASYCTGDEEVFILVEKVDKHNIQVKFFQTSDQGVEIWKAYGKFSKLDVHHQYAIVFKTPPYRSCDIDCEVDVWLQLERPSDGATSQAIPFKYKPIERLRKMPKRQVARTSSGYDDDSSRGGTGRSSSPGGSKFVKDPSFHPSGFGGSSSAGGGDEQHQGPSPGSSESARQGSRGVMMMTTTTGTSGQKFPCDYGKFASEAAKAASSTKVAFNVALSVGEGLHSWAETSDFDFLLHKLRHLLCLVDDNGNNALHAAIWNKQPEPFIKILNIMTSSADISSAINEQNMQNQTPLALAVCMDCADFVQELAHRDADLTVPNAEGDTPVHLAVKQNNLTCLKALIQSNNIHSAINRFNYSSLTPLHLAVTHGHLEAMDMICRAGVNLNVQEGTFGRTPLHLAVEKGSITATMIILQAARESELLEIGNAQNYRGDTPLHVAASAGLTAIAAILLYYGADRTIENCITKENMDSDEVRIGQTPIDVSANQHVLKILEGTAKDWEGTVKYYLQVLDTRPNKDQKAFSLNQLYIDSGIDVKDQSAYSK